LKKNDKILSAEVTRNIMALRWQDKKEQFMLMTVHDGSIKDLGKVDHKTKTPIVKPLCILEYSENMGTVD
jgi:hypothetical protein